MHGLKFNSSNKMHNIRLEYITSDFTYKKNKTYLMKLDLLEEATKYTKEEFLKFLR